VLLPHDNAFGMVDVELEPVGVGAQNGATLVIEMRQNSAQYTRIQNVFCHATSAHTTLEIKCTG